MRISYVLHIFVDEDETDVKKPKDSLSIDNGKVPS